MSGEYWEPWTPKMGQRVRVRLSPECRGLSHESTVEEGYVGYRVGHPEEIDGCTGTVGLFPPDMARIHTDDSHPYWVDLKTSPYVKGRGYCYGTALAAAEIEPLDGER